MQIVCEYVVGTFREPEWHLWWYSSYCSHVMHTKPVRQEINVAVFVCRIFICSWKHVLTKHRTLNKGQEMQHSLNFKHQSSDLIRKLYMCFTK